MDRWQTKELWLHLCVWNCQLCASFWSGSLTNGSEIYESDTEDTDDILQSFFHAESGFRCCIQYEPSRSETRHAVDCDAIESVTLPMQDCCVDAKINRRLQSCGSEAFVKFWKGVMLLTSKICRFLRDSKPRVWKICGRHAKGRFTVLSDKGGQLEQPVCDSDMNWFLFGFNFGLHLKRNIETLEAERQTKKRVKKCEESMRGRTVPFRMRAPWNVPWLSTLHLQTNSGSRGACSLALSTWILMLRAFAAVKTLV